MWRLYLDKPSVSTVESNSSPCRLESNLDSTSSNPLSPLTCRLSSSPYPRAMRLLVFALLTCLSLKAENWPMWRGATGVGISQEKNLPLKWSATENIAWKVTLPYPLKKILLHPTIMLQNSE